MMFRTVRRLSTLALLGLVLARPAAAPRAETAAGPPVFSADAASRLTPAGASVVSVQVAIAYDQLVFAKVAGKFEAAADVEMRLKPKKGEGKTVTRTLRATVGTYRETRIDSLRLTTSETFDVLPGDYTVEVSVHDTESGSKARLKLPVRVENLRAHDGTLGPLSLGHLLRNVSPASATPADIVVNPGRLFSANEPLTVVGGEIYTGETPDAPPESTWTVAYRITDETGQLRLRGTRTVRRAGIVTPFVLAPNLAWLSMGRYTIELRASGKAAPRAVQFEVDETLVDLDHDLDRLLDMIAYSASDRETDSLKSAESVQERQRLWDRFWERRNPEPGNRRNAFKTEYFQRIRYAAENYSSGGEEGWRSDRGRIYVKFGTPDQVEDQAATAYRPAYELWRYYSPNALFVFADRDGFGRYYLVGASRN